MIPSEYRGFKRKMDKYQNVTFKKRGEEIKQTRKYKLPSKRGKKCMSSSASCERLFSQTTLVLKCSSAGALGGMITQVSAITDSFNHAFGHALDICL